MASKTVPSTGIIRTMLHVLCEVCGKSYRSRSGLNDHKRVHQNNAPYKCCAKLFFSKANYQRHRCNKHKDEKRHKCVTCLKTFATETDLSQHIKKIYNEHKYKCDICGLSMSTKGSLLDHTNKHTGIKPHKCKKCGKCYRYQSGLSRHCKQH